jgi:hypothetical protein
MYSHKRLGRQGKRIFFLLRASSFKYQASSFEHRVSGKPADSSLPKKKSTGFSFIKKHKNAFSGGETLFSLSKQTPVIIKPKSSF